MAETRLMDPLYLTWLPMSATRDTVSDRIQTRSHGYLDNAIFRGNLAIWKEDTVNVSTRHILCRIAASSARIMNCHAGSLGYKHFVRNCTL